jgi:hypothetical protein
MNGAATDVTDVTDVTANGRQQLLAGGCAAGAIMLAWVHQ